MKQEIVDDVGRVALMLSKKPGDGFSRREYLNNGARFSMYDIYDGGRNWSCYCEEAGFKPETNEAVPDEVYFERLRRAWCDLGRLPKTSERKKFGLQFGKSRWPTLEAFIKTATSKGIVKLPNSDNGGKVERPRRSSVKEFPEKKQKVVTERSRPIPPIPEKTNRKRWERIGVVGFPYAPQDESGVIAPFSVLCAQGIIPWQILDLNSGKGIDAVCYDDRQHRELKVELKHTLSRSNWNHSIDDLDYVVCWENRWRDFPKPVKELKALVKR